MIDNIVWLIYLADVSRSLSFVMSIFGIVGAAAGLGIAFAYVFDDYDRPGPGASEERLERYNKERLKQKRFIKILLFPGITLLLTAILIPGKDVFYAAAAAQVAKSPQVERVTDKATMAIERWLDRQIGNEESKKDK